MTSVAVDLLERTARAKKQLPPPALRRAIREAAGVSQEDVARVFDPPVHRETVSRWERGERTPRGQHLLAYVELLEVLRGVG